MKYDDKQIEKKWQKIWEERKAFRAVNGADKQRSYLLVEFPYPSGNGLHLGHTRPYTAMDCAARKRRMQGENVLFPIGWDAFGLPAENFAIRNKVHPRTVTERNIAKFKSQAQALGYSFDWEREFSTTDPDYFRWTQWIFLKLLEKGLAYKSDMPVNWCTSCHCVLANEEVVNGGCERCGSEVVRRVKSQWMLKITAYAQRLLDDLSSVDFPPRVAAQQRNWIGRSEGAEIDFATTAGRSLRVYTTRPDTLYGATYMVISPEHPLIAEAGTALGNQAEVNAYREAASKKSDFERTEMAKDKTGVRLDGLCAVNPVTGKEIPIFVSDYVLMSYGTGAIMAVPGHDARDWAFARKFNLPIVEVVAGGDVTQEAYTDCESGVMVNSGLLNGLTVADAKAKMIEHLRENKLGTPVVNFKLRDWVFARQRYWGEPIPVVHCPQCGIVPLPESELPLLLPEVESYEPSDSGESPLAAIREWVEVACPACGADARRETDTMPQWAGSSWYFLRYTDAKNNEALASRGALEYWTPVSWYNGGMEHTTLHLLYSRFWHKFLYDLGIAPTPEPYTRRTSHGMILGSDGQKMSKTLGNGGSPDDVIAEFGADTMRLYILFIGDFEKAVPWNQNAVRGCRKFLERVWNAAEHAAPDREISETHEKLIHRTIKKVGEDIESLKFNTAVAALMTLSNAFTEKGCTRGDIQAFLRLLCPFAPHISEELWERFGTGGLLSTAAWPVYDESKMKDDTVEIAVQILGKVRGAVMVPAGCDEETACAAALGDEKIASYVKNKTVVRRIYVPGKLINLIVKPVNLES